MFKRQLDTHKFTRNCQVFTPLHKIVYVIVAAHFNLVSLDDCTLFKLENHVKYAIANTRWQNANFLRVIDGIFAVLSHEFDAHQETRSNLTLNILLLI